MVFLEWSIACYCRKGVLGTDKLFRRYLLWSSVVYFLPFFFLTVWALWLKADKGLAHNSFPMSDLRAEERCTFVLAWEGTPRNSWWGCAARFSKSWPYFRLKNVIFPHPFSDLVTPKIHTRFQTWPLGRNYHNVIIWLRLECKQKTLQSHFFEFAYFSFFLFIWNWKHKYVHTRPYFPRKPHPIPDQNGQSVYPFSDQKGPKTLPFGAAHTYMAHTGEYPLEAFKSHMMFQCRVE